MGAGELAADQTADKPVPAAAEFRKSCAACHGADGKGDGPMAILLTVETPDLTVLAERNGGTFPFDYVMRLIDGRSAIGPHGTREMPIWGDRYMLDLPAEFRRDPYRTRTAELVRARILELTYYIQSIQH
jgi:mono/diheme cytochrome c family protein